MTTITVAESQQYANSALLQFLRVGEAGPEHLRRWSVDVLGEAGVEEAGGPEFGTHIDNLYDINGRLVFRDFVTPLANGSEFRSRAAANDLMGRSVWFVSAGASLNLGAAREQAEFIASSHDLEVVTGDKALVCYAYPKIGFLCRLRSDPTQHLVIDTFENNIISLSTANSDVVASPELLYCWSPLDIADASVFKPFLRESWDRSVKSLSSINSNPARNQLEGEIQSAQEGANETTVPLVLRGQETPVYCAIACAQMIMEYHGLVKTQAEIAAVMNPDSTGTTNPNQIAGYNTFLSPRFTAIFDETASFAEGRNEIIEGRPMKSGIAGHARVGAGFRVKNDELWLYIYDPWPVNQGTVYWESWGTLHHTNYVYVRRQTF